MRQRTDILERRGFVLPMILVLLVLAAFAMAGAAQRSFDRAVLATQAEQRLRRDWTLRSATLSLTPQIERILADQEAQAFEPVARHDARLTVNGYRMDMVFSDEQAKININTLLELRGKRVTERVIDEMTFTSAATIHLALPSGVIPAERSQRRPITTWSQVAQDIRVDDLAPFDQNTLASHFTCWGDGRINIRRASAGAIETLLSPALSTGDAETIVRVQLERPGIGLEGAIAQLELSKRDLEVVKQRLTDQSSCYALWLRLEGNSRTYDRLIVHEGGEPDGSGSSASSGGGGGRIATFEW